MSEERTRVAIVTGSNKGIGYAIVKLLATRFEGYIYLTARNVDLGNAALAKLKGELGDKITCKELRFHQLDITDDKSVETIQSDLRNAHQKIDLIINNAGVAYKQASTVPFAEQAEVTVGVNFFGTLKASKGLIPLMAPNGRVVNVCSTLGALMLVPGDELKAKLLSDSLELPELIEIANNFIKLAKTGEHGKHGFPNSSYTMSKVLEIALTRVQQRKISGFESMPGVCVSACCPGYVDTDMSNHKGVLTPEQGADTPVFLALLPKGETKFNGQFVSERQVIPWEKVTFEGM